MTKKLASIITTVAVLLNVAAAPASAMVIEITGNGVESDNDANVSVSNTQVVTQTNEADVTNNVKAGATTGNNTANKNNAGVVGIETGDADIDIDVENSLNTNQAELDCCDAGYVEVKIADNAADTENDIDLDLENKKDVFQFNEGDVENDIDAWADTGMNKADKNNLADVSIDTGDAEIDIDVSTSGNSNAASIGGEGSGDDSGVSAWIVGNAADSKNDLDLDLTNLTNLVQGNEMDVDNDVDAVASTGTNDADKNNGGEVNITTGDATVDVMVDNAVNFNWAEIECDCLTTDLWAKIANNAYDSENDITLDLADELVVFQDNCGDNGECDIDNDVEALADSGMNGADKNNGDHDSDPSIDTGDAHTGVSLETSGNSNVFGDAPDWDLDLGGVNLNISLDLGALLGGLFS